MELIFATNNQHKLEEVQQLIGSKFHLKSLADIHCWDDIPETGTTFEENAGQKSKYIFDRFALNCFADDSGLEVDALNNEPGIYSARYSGTRDSEQNLHLVLEKLGNSTNRKARFVTVISLLMDGKEYLFEGTINGQIAHRPSGKKGFGYDPIFIPDGYAITFADLDRSEKNRISHRARAMQKLIEFLNTIG
jgi:XTP/dITP diphosphohydrolase